VCVRVCVAVSCVVWCCSCVVCLCASLFLFLHTFEDGLFTRCAVARSEFVCVSPCRVSCGGILVLYVCVCDLVLFSHTVNIRRAQEHTQVEGTDPRGCPPRMAYSLRRCSF